MIMKYVTVRPVTEVWVVDREVVMILAFQSFMGQEMVMLKSISCLWTTPAKQHTGNSEITNNFH